MVIARVIVLALACAAVGALAYYGYFEPPQKVTMYEKGTYLGKPFTKLTDDQKAALRYRGSNQRY